MRLSPRTSTEPGYGPRIESYLNRWASVALSVMSLTATHSMSVSLARPARRTFRPMRPKPLIPTRTGMRVRPFCGDDPRARAGYRAGGAVSPGERDVAGRWRGRSCPRRPIGAGHEPQLGAVAPVADAVGRVHDAPAAERLHHRVVEARRAGELGDLEGDMVE